MGPLKMDVESPQASRLIFSSNTYFPFTPNSFFGNTKREVINMGRFKNDNRANPALVIEHMLKEVETHIEKMTGKKVRLVAYEDKKSVL